MSLWESISKSVVDRGGAADPAIVADDAELTYGELLERADALARVLRNLGVAPGHVVLVHLDNVPAFLVTVLASARLGAAFASIDVSATDAEVEGIVRLTESTLVVTGSGDEPIADHFDTTIRVDVAGTVTAVEVAPLAPPSVDPTIGCLQFSSGSTGLPKGVLIRHEASVYRTLYYMRMLGLTAADRTLCVVPMSHPHGSETLALPTLMAGGTLFLKSPKYAFPLYILEEIAQHRITFFSSVPSFYDAAVKITLADPPDLGALRLPMCGSAPLSMATAEEFHARYGIRIQQIYGLAELHAICMNRQDAEQIVYDSVGRPVEGIEWRILGTNDEGAEGELVVRSKAMFSGYLNNESATREKLKDGWLHTGDIVSVDRDGQFQIVGRKEDFIKVNGFKVYAAEVEKAIISLPWVRECAVLAERDAVGTERIVAHIVATDPAKPSEGVAALLVRELRGVISEHKLPKRCVLWPALPKSPLGKVLKSRIAAAPVSHEPSQKGGADHAVHQSL
jgi:acyl-CoA synthetase (AMP-forming)/AMP-acid ligase II